MVLELSQEFKLNYFVFLFFNILTTIEFLARRRENEATGMYSRYMGIANRAATQTKTQVRRAYMLYAISGVSKN
jgi:hypothetical protein